MNASRLSIVAAAGLLPLTLLGACTPALPTPTPVKEAVWLDQNWKPGERYWYHHASQGTSTFPISYSWFMALEQPDIRVFGEPKMLADESYLQRFGFIPSPKRLGGGTARDYGYGAEPGSAKAVLAAYNQSEDEVNPDGLPVGFARTKGYVDPTTGTPLPDQIGLTCAACHTGHIEYNEVSLRIDGAPAVINLDALTAALGYSLAYTKVLPGRFDRFADRVLGPNRTAEQTAALREQFEQTLTTLEALAKRGAAQSGNPAVVEGFNRLDALTRIGNTVFTNDLLNGKVEFDPFTNVAAITAPVKYPHIWNASWFDWVQYDASIMQPMVRNAGEAMGVAARVNLSNPDRKLYASSVPVDTLYRMEQLLAGPNPRARKPDGSMTGFQGLTAPKWPQAVLGTVDEAKRTRGAGLYQELCQGCHLPPVDTPAFWDAKYWTKPNAAKQSYLKVTPINVGTDPAQANILQTRTVQLPAFLKVDPASLCNGKPGEPVTKTSFAAALGYVVQKTAETAYDENKVPPAKREEMNGFRPNCLQAEGGYKARPLDGIWAAGPYLHNGSVPTLYDLLSPLAERPKSFCLGLRSFDPVKVGYRTDCADGTFTLDTKIPGNTNVGHQFVGSGVAGSGIIGRGLSEQERWDLVEYLKTL
ncbi:di-heme-cytochrome C peroxidase [Azospirillum sp. A29]|uniref:di-heme-cytochrome C peroxidase n=1 Tax=Azospirillum sp. A29 TaxID=3160606 RepID=UPI00366BB987